MSKFYKISFLPIVIISVLITLFLKCGTTDGQDAEELKIKSEIPNKPEQVSEDIKVTFIELGSVDCIPCKMMQPIMKEIEDKYKGEVKVIFYDVRTQEGKPYSKKYGIRVIPTQVFLDKDDREYFRHEGYFPKNDLIEVLKMQGVK